MGNRNSYDRLVLAAAQNIKERDYWRQQLAGDLPKSTFPYDYNYKNQEQKPGMQRVQFQFHQPLMEKVMKLSGGIDIKLHMILVTGLFILLHKYTDNPQNDIIIGSPILKQKIDREFINTILAFRNQPQDNITFKELLLQVRETIINANENQNYPLEVLMNQLNLPISDNEFSLFEIVILMENLHDKSYIQDIHYNMLFSFLSATGSINGAIEYNSLLYRESSIERIIGHYLHVLSQVLTDVNIKLSHIELMTEQERKQVLFDFSKGESHPGEYPQEKTLHDLFEIQVEQNPDYIALVGVHEIHEKHKKKSSMSYMSYQSHISYKELNKKSHQLAHLLKQKGVQADIIVAIMVERSIEMMIGLLGILKAGGAYLPIDPDYPENRIQYMLADSKAKILLTSEKIVDFSLPEAFNIRPKGASFHLHQSPAPVTSLAYLIYTSGTTGKPKGVMVRHQNVTAYLNAFYREFNVGPRDTVIQLSSYAFDAFVEEVFPLLLKGGKIFIPRIAEMVDINLLSRLILKHAVSIVDCTPLLLNEFNQLTGKNTLENVKLFISGGDILKAEYVDNLVNIGKVYNTYGPTEATVCASYYKLPGQLNNNIPIGKPIANYSIYILDRNLRPVSIGIIGEICISGPGVTRGYLNRPELTEEKFLATEDTEGTEAGFNQRIYKTGDLGRWLPEGNIECLGRVDKQVKIRGYRIELGEIESHLRSHEKIKEAVVVAQFDESGEKYLCAYAVPIVSSENLKPDPALLREYLLKRLPDYMVPAYVVFIRQIPLNQSGKVDSSKLPAPQIASTKEYVPPSTIIEKELAAVFSTVLNINIEKIGSNDDFFELGGNSLKLIKLTTQIQEQFKTSIPLTHLLKNCNIKEIAKLIRGNVFAAHREETIILLNREKPGKIFCFPPGVAYGITYMELAVLLDHYALYAFNFIENNRKVEAYVDIMMQIQPQGPFVLLAYSAGGRLCLKAAEILEKRGRQVSEIILMECFLHGKEPEPGGLERMITEFYDNFKSSLIELGIESLTEKAIEKINGYVIFLKNLGDFAPVNGKIHFIAAEDNKNPQEPLGWEKLTNSEYIVYNGFGKHQYMLEPGNIKKNAGIINEILAGNLNPEVQ